MTSVLCAKLTEADLWIKTQLFPRLLRREFHGPWILELLAFFYLKWVGTFLWTRGWSVTHHRHQLQGKPTTHNCSRERPRFFPRGCTLREVRAKGRSSAHEDGGSGDASAIFSCSQYGLYLSVCLRLSLRARSRSPWTHIQRERAAFLLKPPTHTCCASMDVLVPNHVNALNGTTIKIPCTFTSCYKMDVTKFSMNWTYQETLNDTQEMFMAFYKKKGILPLRSNSASNRFGERVMFAGNMDKNDMSITLSDVQMGDVGYYNCYVINPPDRIHGHGVIQLDVVTELPAPRDSTIAVAIGASVGGALALLILSMVVLKCLRRHQKQELISEEKMEEEGKLEAEGVAEEGTKHP
uniref:Ig-like domain-containing protein n=1 Tax=Scophthalmus maximus TaxID=52904 RepID=A0A8D3CYJ5_SCOMX